MSNERRLFVSYDSTVLGECYYDNRVKVIKFDYLNSIPDSSCDLSVALGASSITTEVLDLVQYGVDEET